MTNSSLTKFFPGTFAGLLYLPDGRMNSIAESVGKLVGELARNEAEVNDGEEVSSRLLKFAFKLYVVAIDSNSDNLRW